METKASFRKLGRVWLVIVNYILEPAQRSSSLPKSPRSRISFPHHLPQLIDTLAPGYRFHLGNYTIHQEETMLFATR
jgi:hypothetical protein